MRSMPAASACIGLRLAAALSLCACGANDTSTGSAAGSAGTIGSGGAAGSGAASSGGASGAAGTSASGGQSGSAGAAGHDAGGSGGSGGSSGASGSGGSSGASGTAGSAGDGGSGGTAGASGGAGSGGGGDGGSGIAATIQPGAIDRILLIGTVLTPDTSYDGEVLVEGKLITCAAPGTSCEAQAGATGATWITTHGIIAPGLIDTHNHILFDVFDDDDWVPSLPKTCVTATDCKMSAYCSGTRCDCMSGTCRYTSHTQWPNEAEYTLMLDYKQCLEDASQGKPIWCPRAFDGTGSLECELDKWGELKGLIAGTTSIVGLPGTGYPCYASLARSMGVSQNDLGSDAVQTSALFPPSSSSADGVCTNYSDGSTKAYLIHVGEGVDATAAGEFATLGTVTTTDGCLYAPQTSITHGTAFGATELATMAAAQMKLTWSPASNVALYGKTTNIPAALAAGVEISLAPDWSMGGSQNLLDELRFANGWDDAHFGDVLDAKALVQMVTTHPAAALAAGNSLGRIAAGYLADLIVVSGEASAPYDALLAATPRDVRLVLVGGTALYGDDQLVAAAPAVPGCETFDACGRQKFLCVAESSAQDKLDQTYAQLASALGSAFSTLDQIAALSPSACTATCPSSEACYARTSIPQVPASNCAATCAADEACFHATSTTDKCLTVNACAPRKTKAMSPIAPLFRCP